MSTNLKSLKTSKNPTSTSFKAYVEDVERNNTPEGQHALEGSRRRFTIGSRLLDRRLAAGMTQRELARASGIDQGEISRIESGLANPTVQTLQALGTPLGVVLDFGQAT
jgi:ribosome-binding protein aMBF1 (putative translation factor)